MRICDQKEDGDMKIAVVGGNGFIGREFLEYSSDRGHDPVAIGSDHNAFSEDGAKEIKDILGNCDAMAFLAAKRSGTTFSITDYIYNVTLAEQYFQFAEELHISNVVVTSSMSVYSSIDIPWKENDFQAPLSLYGASKQAIDALALWYNENKVLRIKSLRLAQVIGMGERKGYLLNTLIDNAAGGKRQIIYGKGAGRRQYIYVKDVCCAILHCLEKEPETVGVFNIGMKDNISIMDLAETVNEAFGNSAGIEKLEDNPEDIREYLMNIGKAEKELHWKPAYDLKAAFAEIKEQCLRI